MYPTEIVTLPSRGKYFPEGHPLRESGGKLEIKYMTAKEEDILTSTNLIKSGQVMDKFLESIVVHEGVDHKDLATGDIAAILVATRVFSYGKDYDISVGCPYCGEAIESAIDLTQLETPDEEDLIESNSDGTVTFEVPSGKRITIRYLSRRDEIEVDKQNEILEKKNLPKNLVTSRLKRIIVSIDGEDDPAHIAQEVQNMVVADVSEIRKQHNMITPTVDMSISVKCQNPECERTVEGELPISANFFWPDL